MANCNFVGKGSVTSRASPNHRRQFRTKPAMHVGIGLVGATAVSLTLWAGLAWIVSQVG
jgi:hypothetical protein